MCTYEVDRDRRDERDGGVVEDMEEGDLAGGLPQHEDECVQKLPVLLVVEEPEADLQQAIGGVVELTTVRVAHELAAGVVEFVEGDADGGDAGEAHAG